MKKIVTIFLVILSATALAACGNGSKIDKNATYRTYTSGTSNLNPYSETLATASDLFDYLTDSLYTGDYDWDAAIEQGIATKVGDFTNTAELPYNRVPAMAAGEPVDVSGDGTVWQITLKEGLKFEDGTVINAQTFNYSWQQLLSPTLLNDRAVNLYDKAYLPILNAEAYVKQKGLKSDSFGFNVFVVGSEEVRREYSYYGTTAGGYDIYVVEPTYSSLVGPAGEHAYVENWGSASYGKGGWVLETEADTYFMTDAEGKLYAPTAGWTFNGQPVPVATSEHTAYFGAYPAYAKEDGTLVAVDANGNPTGGTTIANDPVAWSSVGFKVINDLTIEITLSVAKDAWYVKGQLTSGITGVVHPAKFEAGLNAEKTSTTYGTIDNPLVSYGPYVLKEWQDGVLFLYERNDDHYDAASYRIKYLRYDVIADQSIAVNEFKAGRLDIVSAAGDYFKEFQDSPYIRLTPATQFMRFAFNIAERPNGTTNPILQYADFRTAFYYAIDRQEFVTSVRAPGYANQGFVGPVYVATEYGSTGYRDSEAGKSVFESRSSETNGYNPVLAKELFDKAYDAAVAEGKITAGQKVTVEYTYYNVESNQKVAEWVKSTVEAIFNGSGAQRFELKLTPVSNDALEVAWDSLDFDMTFGGWQGLNFNPVSLLGQVYNSNLDYMLEGGFDTANLIVKADLPNTKAALEKWIDQFEDAYTSAGTGATSTQITAYNNWKSVLAKFGVGDGVSETELQVTYHQMYSYAGGVFYNVNEVNYAGKNEDFERITAALEEALLDEMIAIPLFTVVSATVYSSRVVFEAQEYHAWMGWGGLKYMYIKSE